MMKNLGTVGRLGLVAAVWLVSCHCALALEGGAVDPNDSSTFAGVGSLSLASGGTFSGVLIGSRYVLTAQHVVGSGSDPSQWTFNVNLDSLGESDRSFAIARVYTAPGFIGFGNGTVPRNDLTILELKRAVPGSVPVFELSATALSLGKQITLVGYGGTGAQVKRIGTNVVDYLEAPSAGATQDVFAYDFDTDTTNQATVVGGDSGSGMFVKEGNVWKLAGINTFSWENPNPSLPGATVRGGGGLIVSAYSPWIQAVTAVPEPSTWALFCPGMVLVLWMLRRSAPRRGDA
jgi:V8-like Glu-specific endopeptidase